MKTNFSILLIMLLLFNGCDKNEIHSPAKPLYEVQSGAVVPKFDADNAFNLIEKQVEFGPRNPGSYGHSLAMNYLKKELLKYADEVIIQNFTYPGYNENLNLANLIGKFNPSDKNRILLAAHWDTRPRSEEAKDTTKKNLPVIGANDGASGVGVLLEAARIIRENKISYGIDIILFDGEDYGKRNDLANYCLGSKYFSSNLPAGYAPAFGILLDMVGDREAFFPKEGNSLKYAPDVVKLIWNIADQLNASTFLNAEAPEIYDDHVPLNQAGIKTVNIIDLELIGADSPNKRRNYWHSEKDTMQNIGKETLQQVGDVLIHFIYSLKFNY